MDRPRECEHEQRDGEGADKPLYSTEKLNRGRRGAGGVSEDERHEGLRAERDGTEQGLAPRRPEQPVERGEHHNEHHRHPDRSQGAFSVSTGDIEEPVRQPTTEVCDPFDRRPVRRGGDLPVQSPSEPHLANEELGRRGLRSDPVRSVLRLQVRRHQRSGRRLRDRHVRRVPVEPPVARQQLQVMRELEPVKPGLVDPIVVEQIRLPRSEVHASDRRLRQVVVRTSPVGLSDTPVAERAPGQVYLRFRDRLVEPNRLGELRLLEGRVRFEHGLDEPRVAFEPGRPRVEVAAERRVGEIGDLLEGRVTQVGRLSDRDTLQTGRADELGPPRVEPSLDGQVGQIGHGPDRRAEPVEDVVSGTERQVALDLGLGQAEALVEEGSAEIDVRAEPRAVEIGVAVEVSPVRVDGAADVGEPELGVAVEHRVPQTETTAKGRVVETDVAPEPHAFEGHVGVGTKPHSLRV